MHAQATYHEPSSNFMDRVPAPNRQKAIGVAAAAGVLAIGLALAAGPGAIYRAATPQAAPKPEAAGRVDKLLAPNSVEFRLGERSLTGAAGSTVGSSADKLLTPEQIRFRGDERTVAGASDPFLTPNAIESRQDERSDSASGGSSSRSGSGTAPGRMHRE